VLVLRVKMVGKIFRNSGFIFSYFSVIFVFFGKCVIGTKTGHSVAGIGRNTVQLSYRPFLDCAGKSGNFLDLSRISHTAHLGSPALFIWAGPAIFFLLIQRFYKY
jgi:hypothetical protein